MKATISRTFRETPIRENVIQTEWFYLVQWINDDGAVESHEEPTSSAAVAWCRTQEIGWVRFVGFSEEFIEIGVISD